MAGFNIFNIDIQYRRPGYLFLTWNSSTAEQLSRNVGPRNEHGNDSRFALPRETTETCPGLRAEKFRGSAYAQGDGFADPNLAFRVLAQPASKTGAKIRTGVKVTSILRNRDRQVAGVQTTDEGELRAGYVVNAAGAQAARVGELAGLYLPIVTLRRQLMVLETK